jgi:hypothetical protein
VQKLYVLNWEDSAEWFVSKDESDGYTELEREDKLERVRERRKHLKSLVLYNLVQGHVARAIPRTHSRHGAWTRSRCTENRAC